MLKHRTRKAGFSLLELAIVLLIVGLLLGGLIMPLSARMDQQKIDTTRQQLEQVRQALVGYALARDALPCPATPASSGLASATALGCTRQHGFVPAVTLGLPGTLNQDKLLLDAWGSPIRYSVTNSDANGNGNWDFVRPGEMRTVTLASLAPSLDICTTTTGSSANGLREQRHDADQHRTGGHRLARQGLGDGHFGGPAGEPGRDRGRRAFGPQLPGGRRRSLRQPDARRQAGNEFDDIVTWVSPATLYGELVSAGRLP